MTRHSDPRGPLGLTSLLALSLLLQACASAGVSTSQNVRVETPGCAPVACELRNDLGSWQIPSTPGEVTLTTSHAALKVSCLAKGGALGDGGASPSMSEVSGAAAVAGGVTGGVAAGATFGATALTFIPVLGAIVLLGSMGAGAAAGQAVESQGRALTYPALISIPMSCDAHGDTPLATASPGAPLGLEVRGLTTTQAHAAGLGERTAVLVTGVKEHAGGAMAGLHRGDILLSLGGQELGDAADLQERVQHLPAGTPTPLRVWRDGRTLDLVLTRQPAAP